MSVIAEIRVSDHPLVLMPSVQAAPGMVLKREWAIADQTSDPVVFVWAHGGDFEAFEASLPDDPTIREFECIDREERQRLYRVVIDRSVAFNPAPVERETGASRLSIETNAEGAVLELRLPDRGALQQYVDRFREEGFSVELLRAYRAGEGSVRSDLSTKQAEALRAAHENGYFEVPRGTELSALAAELGVSEQAVSERVRRGLSAVLDEALTGPAAAGERRSDSGEE